LAIESRYSKVVIDVDNRNFTIQVLRFDNGSFVSITEHQDKIGGVLASIGTDSIPVSSTIIPAKSESLFLKFTIQVLRFDNGSFVSITEHQDKIGGVLASIGTDSIPVSSTIIPAKSESLFLKLISERISSIIKGINIISAFIPQELDSKIANALMSKIKEILEK